MKTDEITTKIVGLLLIGLAVYFFKIGLEYDDSESYYLMNIKLIGVSLLLLIGGIALLVTQNSISQIFGI